MDEDDRILAYLQDRLEPADRATFEAELETHPDLRAQVTSLSAAAAELGARPVPEGARDAGWERLSSAIEAERQPVAANTNRGVSLLKVASIVAATVLFWQFAVVPQLPGTGGGFVPASATVEGPALRVAFAEGATMAEITALLQETGARLTDGPGALGLYTLTFATEAERDAAEALLAGRPELFTDVSRP
ncbi:hypothetical protein [Pseudooceanicola nanhaiensis]|uniref:hypothetical protein n=1 Tax=Pseudooceanicola nanhaiensis TaxID=375761 RepID=UPI001CD772D7|nr:hypothetical protein [Pseudooceanicola nanhaiensis]MCA0920669.1 hypothetical protein [Pseudooceanicola nanhaiensis]